MKLTNIPIEEDLSTQFKDLISASIMDYKEEIRDISEIASKEQSIEKIMMKMKGEWRGVKFQLAEFRDSGCLILRGIDPILDKLDEDIGKIIAIASSPFIRFLES